MPESSSFKTPFHSKRVHGSQTLLKFSRQHFYLNFPFIYNKLSCKTLILVRSEILGLFGNTSTGDHMCSCHRREKFPQQVQTLLSLKLRTFSWNFIVFLQPPQNFLHLKENDQLHSLNISELIHRDKCRYFNAPKLLF